MPPPFVSREFSRARSSSGGPLRAWAMEVFPPVTIRQKQGPTGVMENADGIIHTACWSTRLEYSGARREDKHSSSQNSNPCHATKNPRLQRHVTKKTRQSSSRARTPAQTFKRFKVCSFQGFQTLETPLWGCQRKVSRSQVLKVVGRRLSLDSQEYLLAFHSCLSPQ